MRIVLIADSRRHLGLWPALPFPSHFLVLVKTARTPLTESADICARIKSRPAIDRALE